MDDSTTATVCHTGMIDEEQNLQQLNNTKSSRWKQWTIKTYTHLSHLHSRTPYIRVLQLPAILIILLLILVNLAIWTIFGILLASRYTHLMSTAALAYSLGLRHALDADHISAIDLMTRRLIATGQRPVTVGTFFSLGHSTIVVVTSIVVAATAAGVSKRFNGFSKVGGIIGSSVSACFLIALGVMNAYILYKLIVQLKKVIRMKPEEEEANAWNVEGGGILFRVLKKMFKLIDRPWKMYPLGVLFGLGFDTSSEVALLGISSIQGAKGTSMWLIMIFPILFTAGMCLIDTIDGALMSSLYLAPLAAADKKDNDNREDTLLADIEVENDSLHRQDGSAIVTPKVRSPLTFLYYSIVLTALTVVVALVIGTIQLLTMILNVAVSDKTAERSRFWQGVQTAGDYYDVIGGVICGSFIIVGVVSVLCYKPWRQWVDRERTRLHIVESNLGRGAVELLDDDETYSAKQVRSEGLSEAVARVEVTGSSTLNNYPSMRSGGKGNGRTLVNISERADDENERAEGSSR